VSWVARIEHFSCYWILLVAAVMVCLILIILRLNSSVLLVQLVICIEGCELLLTPSLLNMRTRSLVVVMILDKTKPQRMITGNGRRNMLLYRLRRIGTEMVVLAETFWWTEDGADLIKC
jgi:hypothetical protein